MSTTDPIPQKCPRCGLWHEGWCADQRAATLPPPLPPWTSYPTPIIPDGLVEQILAIERARIAAALCKDATKDSFLNAFDIAHWIEGGAKRSGCAWRSTLPNPDFTISS